MSRGLSRVQRTIVGLLDGTISAPGCATGSRLATGELVNALQALELIPSVATWKHAAFSVRRACRSLERRGILAGRLEWDIDHHWTSTLFWSLVERPADSAERG